MTDTSDINVRMCHKATEIQTLGGGKYSRTTLGIPCYKLEDGYELIWLPTLEEFQDMAGGFPTALGEFNSWYHEAYYDNSVDEYAKGFTSTAQLWLAFVMEDKFNKQWDGDEWVTCSKGGIDE